ASMPQRTRSTSCSGLPLTLTARLVVSITEILSEWIRALRLSTVFGPTVRGRGRDLATGGCQLPTVQLLTAIGRVMAPPLTVNGPNTLPSAMHQMPVRPL